MTILSLNLPEKVKATAEQRAAAAGYASVESYIVSLIEADEIAPISSDTEAAILEGLDSGPLTEITPEFIASIRQKARSGRKGAA